MPETTLFSASQYESICNSLPDPTFILTASGRYAAILGGKDKRYYHDGSSLVGKYLSDVLSTAKTQWFLQQIHCALTSQQMLVVEYELSAHDVLGLPTEGRSNLFILKVAFQLWSNSTKVRRRSCGWQAILLPVKNCSSNCKSKH